MPTARAEHALKVWIIVAFGIVCVVALTAIFVSGHYYFERIIDISQKAQARTEIPVLTGSEANIEAILRHSLDKDALDLRHARGTASLIMRTYAWMLALTLGSILGLVGALFVLGRVDSELNVAEGGVDGWKIAIMSSSPGLIIATLGSLLVIGTVFTAPEVSVRDGTMFASRGPGTVNIMPPMAPTAADVEALLRSFESTREVRDD